MTTERLRIDKWLWHARFFRTRVLAQSAAASGLLRLNGARVEKASSEVKLGDLLTLPHGGNVIVVRVLACGIRRGPATQARTLYEIHTDAVLDRSAARP